MDSSVNRGRMSAVENSVVEITNLARSFGANAALGGVSLSIPKGTVFGLVGPNGAGKTTLIKHVLGLLRAQSGSVSVFGLEPVANPVPVLARIGYLSEVTELPDWMSVGELMRFTQPFYPGWDQAYADSLCRTFELDVGEIVGELSKGQRARTALMLALAHRAELLVLDEPSSGLDPLVRRDILRAVIRTIADEGRTVLFSSHLLDEVERVADQVAIIERGRIIENAPLDALKASFHRIAMRFGSARSRPPEANGFFGWEGDGEHWWAYFKGDSQAARNQVASLEGELVEISTPSLDDIFVALVGHSDAAA